MIAAFLNRLKKRRELKKDLLEVQMACEDTSHRIFKLTCGGRIILPTRKDAKFPTRAMAFCSCHDHPRGLLMGPLAQQDIYCSNLKAVCEKFSEHDAKSLVKTVREANAINTKRGKK